MGNLCTKLWLLGWKLMLCIMSRCLFWRVMVAFLWLHAELIYSRVVHCGSSMGRDVSNHSESPVRGWGSSHRRSTSWREISPTRRRSCRRNGLDAREKHSGCAKSPKRAPFGSPVAWLPSSQTKRLRRAQAEREVERETEKARLPSPVKTSF